MDQEKENILNNLKKSGPGFTVPKAYFEKMEARIEQKMDSTDSNSDTNSDTNSDLKSNKKNTLSLDQIGKEHGFKIPDGYFDENEPKLKKLKTTKIVPLKNNYTRILALSIAASILLFFGIKYMNPTQNAKSQMVFQDEEFINWIESDLVELNSYEIAEAFNDVELDQVLYPEDEVDEYLNTIDIEHLILEN